MILLKANKGDYQTTHCTFCWSAPWFHFKDTFASLLAPLDGIIGFHVAPFFWRMQMSVISNDSESKLSELCVPGSQWGGRELWNPALILSLSEFDISDCSRRLCWVIQRITGSQFLHVNFLKESARHVFLKGMFGAAYAKYYNTPAVMSFVFLLLSPFIHGRPLPLPPEPRNSISEII